MTTSTQPATIPWADLAAQAHQNAVDRGETDRDTGEALMDIVGSLWKALEADRDISRVPLSFVHELHCPCAPTWSLAYCDCTPKPEGVVAHLADAIVKCLALIQFGDEAVDWSILDSDRMYLFDKDVARNLGRALRDLTARVCSAEDWLGGVRWNVLFRDLVICEALILRYDADVEAVLRQMLAHQTGKG